MCSGIKSCMMELLEFILQFRVPISKKLRISALLLLSKDKIVGTVSLKIASFFKNLISFINFLADTKHFSGSWY